MITFSYLVLFALVKCFILFFVSFSKEFLVVIKEGMVLTYV